MPCMIYVKSKLLVNTSRPADVSRPPQRLTVVTFSDIIHSKETPVPRHNHAIIQTANNVAATQYIKSGRYRSRALAHMHIKHEDGGQCDLSDLICGIAVGARAGLNISQSADLQMKTPEFLTYICVILCTVWCTGIPIKVATVYYVQSITHFYCFIFYCYIKCNDQSFGAL